MKEINYTIDNINHKVLINNDIIANILKDILNLKSDRKILFIYDKNINNQLIKNLNEELKTTGCKIFSIKVKGGRENKNTKFLFKIIDILSENQFTKKSIIISFGGGVVGDVCGLISSLYMRGLIYFHVPSTMMAIMDSCLGGKNAINYKNRINLLGTYYHPLRVYISAEVINQIPDKEFFSGFSEAIKCGIIYDNKILKLLKEKENSIIKRKYKDIELLIYMVLKTKLNFFIDDIRENNKRLMLNFGHTFAHAIESTGDLFFKNFDTNHGQAVAVGILCEMMYAKVNNNFIEEIKSLFIKYNLPVVIDLKKKKFLINFQKKVFENLYLDKKKISRYPRYIHIEKQGKPKIGFLKNNNLIEKILLKSII